MASRSRVSWLTVVAALASTVLLGRTDLPTALRRAVAVGEAQLVAHRSSSLFANVLGHWA